MKKKHLTYNSIAMNEKEHKQLILGMVLDATLSFSAVYPQVYYFLEHLFMNLERIRKDEENIDVNYSIVLLRNQPELLKISQDSFVSKNEAEVINCLANISFYGGGMDGTENLNEAMDLQLKTMNQYCDMIRTKDRKMIISPQLILLTDSCASKFEQFPDFTQNEKGIYGNYFNYGLQQAFVISYQASYMPKLRIVNSDFSLTESRKNRCLFGGVEELIQMSEEEMLKAAEWMAEEILRQLISNV